MLTNLAGFIEQNPLVFAVLIIWSLVWKGLALWRAGRLGQKYWFVALLIFNTVGLLEILYLTFFSRKSCCFCHKSVGDGKKTFFADEAKAVGKKLGIDWSKFNVEQFRLGMDVELEHGTRDAQTNVSNDDPLTTGKIALAHLIEFPDYYTRLERLEEEAKEFWSR